MMDLFLNIFVLLVQNVLRQSYAYGIWYQTGSDSPTFASGNGFVAL